jgi:RNA polymerase sigma-70 factor (family 1)
MQQLINRIRENADEFAFNELYRNHAHNFFRFAQSFVREREIAEEIVNDVLVRLWVERSKTDQIRNIQVYLYNSIKNACLNHIRSISSKRNNETKVTEAYYFHLSVDPSQILISKELSVTMLSAINNLPPRCKLIFKMVKEDGFSCKEVACILGLSDKTVFAQLSIALKKLHAILYSK